MHLNNVRSVENILQLVKHPKVGRSLLNLPKIQLSLTPAVCFQHPVPVIASTCPSKHILHLYMGAFFPHLCASCSPFLMAGWLASCSAPSLPSIHPFLLSYSWLPTPPSPFPSCIYILLSTHLLPYVVVVFFFHAPAGLKRGSVFILVSQHCCFCLNASFISGFERGLCCWFPLRFFCGYSKQSQDPFHATMGDAWVWGNSLCWNEGWLGDCNCVELRYD